MIPKKFKTFLSQVKEATDQNILQWCEADNEAYFCEHKNHSLHINHFVDPDLELDGFGFRMVTDKKVTPFTVSRNESDYLDMKILYEAIIANANMVDDDISSFFV